MPERDLSTYTEHELLSDPNIEQATLGHLATSRLDLRPAILAHPNVYPELADWLRARGVEPAARPEAQSSATPQQAAQEDAAAAPGAGPAFGQEPSAPGDSPVSGAAQSHPGGAQPYPGASPAAQPYPGASSAPGAGASYPGAAASGAPHGYPGASPASGAAQSHPGAPAAPGGAYAHPGAVSAPDAAQSYPGASPASGAAASYPGAAQSHPGGSSVSGGAQPYPGASPAGQSYSGAAPASAVPQGYPGASPASGAAQSYPGGPQAQPAAPGRPDPAVAQPAPGQPQQSPGQHGSGQPAAVSPEQWAADFRQRAGREPSLTEYQAAVAAGKIAATDQSWEKMQAGAAQMAAGAKDFFQQRIAPAAQSAAREFQSAVSDKASSPMAKFVRISAFVLPAAALVALISVFLPVFSYSVDSAVFSDSGSISLWESGGAGALVLVLSLLTIAGGVVAIVMKATWSRITAAVLGFLTGAFGLFASIHVFVQASDAGGFGGFSGFGVDASAGASIGAYLLLIASIIVIAAGVGLLLPTGAAAGRPANPYAPGRPAAPFGAAAGYPVHPAQQGGQPSPSSQPSPYPGQPQAQPAQPYPGQSQNGQSQSYPGQPQPGGQAPYGQPAAPQQPAQPNPYGQPGSGQPGPYGQPPQNPYGQN